MKGFSRNGVFCQRRQGQPRLHWPTCRISGCSKAVAGPGKPAQPAAHGLCGLHYRVAKRRNTAPEPAA